MAEPSPAPDFGRLPGDPVGFFGLAPGYERDDLKRAYNRLIRIYKPEKHPAEFQRIREAYESLDESLRYGRSAQVQLPKFEWNAESTTDSKPQPTDPATGDTRQPSRHTAHDDRSAAPKPKSLLERVTTEPTAELYRELAERPQKNPYEFYALAIMADVVDKTPQAFVRWLIKGIEAHPRDGALHSLLHAYLRSPLPAAELVDLLPRIAKAMRSDYFYPMTEAAWSRLLGELPFAQFAKLLSQCEAELRDAQIACRMVFTIAMLKSASWHDTQGDWTRARFDFIEENFEQIPRSLEWEVEILGALREYMKVRTQFLKLGGFRTQLDAALRQYFCSDQEVGDRAIVACQMLMLHDTQQLLDAFPLEEDAYPDFYTLWAWVSYDVASRQGNEEPESKVEPHVWADRVKSLLNRMDAARVNSWAGLQLKAVHVPRWGTLIAIVLVGGFTLTFLSFLLTGEFSESADAVTVCIIGSFVISVAAAWYLKSKLDERFWYPWIRRRAQVCYNKLWRRDVFDFQQRSRISDQLFRKLFEHLAEHNEAGAWINSFVQRDYAPALLSIAQRFEV